MRVLHLTLKKKWFDMIASGEKKEEYREVKPYWKKRLEDTVYEPDYDCITDFFKEFDVVKFVNGYAKNAPSLLVQWKGTSIGEGRNKWGADIGEKYYCIHLGKILTKDKEKDI